MNNKEFVSEMARRTGLTASAAQQRTAALVKAVQGVLAAGENVDVPSFGRFEVKKRAERIFVSPSSGQRMLVPPKVVVGFKPSAGIKGALDKDKD